MSKAGSSILKGAREALTYSRGEAKAEDYVVHIPEKIDVKLIRKQLGMTQAEFSARFGINLATLQNWERGGRVPPGPTRAYLLVIHRNPKAVIDALRG